MIQLKSEKELEFIAQASAIVAQVLKRLQGFITAGITTREIEDLAQEAISLHKGASLAFKGYKGFPGYICTSVNEEVVHGIPGAHTLKEGDIISLDVGVGFNGYYGDGAITVPVGKISPKLQKLIDTTKEALCKGIEKAKVDNRVYDISASIEEHVKKNGFSVVREFVGHGIGSKIHEDPAIPNFGKPHTGARLKAGMVLAIEPMVNMGAFKVRILKDGWTVVTQDSEPSAHFEHTVAITEGGPRILTQGSI